MINDQNIQCLGNNIKIFVSKNHTFSTDSLLLANFASPKTSDIVLEIGAGCGIISFIFCRDNKSNHITALEIQKSAADMMKHSVKMNSLENKISVINGDINDASLPIRHNQYDMIVCNPPYKKQGTGKINKNSELTSARHEISCSIDDITAFAFKALKNKGTLCLCNRTERLTDVIISMRKNKIEPKILQFVHYKQDKPPKLFLIKGKKLSSSGLNCLSPLIVYKENGDFSNQMSEIYRYI